MAEKTHKMRPTRPRCPGHRCDRGLILSRGSLGRLPRAAGHARVGEPKRLCGRIDGIVAKQGVAF
jgi:hypothetical protein